ncbi:MAG: amino acid ABC transporter substrate-binding protein [Acidimicrobiia bacterium]
MLKRLAVLFAVLALVAAACGSSDEGSDTTTTTAASTEEGGGDTGQEATGDDTLATVQARGTLKCGVSTSAPGFTDVNPDGTLSGFDVDYCRAIAAAVLGDAEKVEFRQLTAKERFAALESGEIDVLVRNTTWTQTRDTDLPNDFVATTFYDGQQIMGNPANIPALQPGLTTEESFAAIDGAVVCTNAGTTTEQNIKEGAEQNGATIQLQTVENFTEAMDGFIAGSCDVVTTDGSGLFGHRAANTAAGLEGAENWVIFPDAPISKEPLGPVVRQNDSTWMDIIQWTVFATFAAEELGVDSTNAEAQMDASGEVGRLLGAEGELQTAMGLSADAFLQSIKQVGNYAEIYDRNLTPLKLSRDGTFNEQWYNGGLIYSPPFR